jgi:hypothetical protein
VILLCISDSSSGDEAMGDDFASADLWAARIEAAERGEAGICFLHNLGHAVKLIALEATLTALLSPQGMMRSSQSSGRRESERARMCSWPMGSRQTSGIVSGSSKAVAGDDERLLVQSWFAQYQTSF